MKEVCHAGFAVGRYISLEKIVEDTKETYYEALYKSSQGWHEEKHNLTPWSEYFLGVMLLTAYREFENRIGLLLTSKGAKGAMVVAAIQRLPRSRAKILFGDEASFAQRGSLSDTWASRRQQLC